MSKLVGMMLHTALTTAGHSEFSSWDSHVDIDADDIIVTFHTANKYTSVRFHIPNRLFDPVEYAQAKWPEWFVKKEPKEEQLWR